MERRVLLAISLSFLVLFAYQTLLSAPGTGAARSPTPGVPAHAAVRPGWTTHAGAPVPAATAAGPRRPQPPAALRADIEEREFVIETSSVRAVFTNRGARLKHWELKRYNRESGGAGRSRAGRHRRPAAAVLAATRHGRRHGRGQRRALRGREQRAGHASTPPRRRRRSRSPSSRPTACRCASGSRCSRPASK